jgi:FkbM family methyltransferase
MGARQVAKKLVLATGLFPVARAIRRKLGGSARAEVDRDVALYSPFIEPGSLVFDVGVNLAQKAVAFSKCGARVVGVEPNPLCIPTIEYEMRGRAFSLVAMALGAEPARMMLNIVGTESTASLRPDWEALNDHGPPVQVEVEVTTLDALIAEHGHPHFCKIDVEGFELEVLKGLSQPIKTVTFEYHAVERDRMEDCLVRLNELAPIKLNLISINADHFEFSRWVTLAEFRDESPEIPRVGDCFVVR